MNILYQIMRSIISKKVLQSSLMAFILMAFFVQRANACTVTANFTYSVVNTTVTFNNTSTGANKYTWYFADGNTSNAAAPVHNYSGANRYRVILMAFDTTISNCYDTSEIEVLVPGCSVFAGFRYSISGGTVSFENNSVNLVGLSTSYEWDFGDGSAHSSDKNPVHVYAGAGPHNVMLRVYDTAFSGCEDTLFRNFDTTDCHTVISFTYTFIGPKKIKITNTSVNANTFSFAFDSNSEFEYDFPYPGTFDVYLTGGNTWCGGRWKDTFIQRVHVPGCHANAVFNYGSDTNSTFAGIIYDYSTFRAGASYMWHFGDGDSSSTHAPNHVYPGPGKYNLCLTIRDSTCVSTFCDSIEFDSSGSMVGFSTPFGIQVIDKILSVNPKKSSITDQVSVYPNPGSGIFTFSQEKFDIIEIKVYDLQGKVILSGSFSERQVKIDLTDAPSGVFVTAVKDTQGHVRMIKLIKQ